MARLSHSHSAWEPGPLLIVSSDPHFLPSLITLASSDTPHHGLLPFRPTRSMSGWCRLVWVRLWDLLSAKRPQSRAQSGITISVGPPIKSVLR